MLTHATEPRPLALLMRGERETSEDRNLSRLLDFFGIRWKAVAASDARPEQSEAPYAVLGSVELVAALLRPRPDETEEVPDWIGKAASVYLYGFACDDPSLRLLRLLTGNPQARIAPVEPGESTMTVTGGFPEMCGPMSGLQVPAILRPPLSVCHPGPSSRIIIHSDQGEFFFEVIRSGVPFFLNTCSRTIDITTPSAQYFDIKNFFCEAAPIIFFLKWAFPDAFNHPAVNASLVVDDPPLKPRYGFLDFREALDLMDRHEFSTTIAFIPWNWRRTDTGTVRLFQSRPERLSVVIHGCDHTTGEFAVRSPELLGGKVKTAVERMDALHHRTGLRSDRVMVFPRAGFRRRPVAS